MMVVCKNYLNLCYKLYPFFLMKINKLIRIFSRGIGIQVEFLINFDEL